MSRRERLSATRFVIAASIGVILIASSYVAYLFAVAGELTRLPVAEHACTRGPIAQGAEDAVWDPLTRSVIFSSIDPRGRDSGARVAGALMRFDPETTTVKALPLDLNSPVLFHPLGLATFVPGNGRAWLFVISRPPGDLAIERFRLHAHGLEHVGTWRLDVSLRLNDLLAVSPSTVYATRDHGAESSWGRLFEDYGRMPWSEVLLIEQGVSRRVAGGLRFANGLSSSADGRHIFVAQSVDHSIRVFRRYARTNAIVPLRDLQLPFGPDNLTVGPDGSLWAAGHPRLLTYVRYASAATERSPSAVARIDDPTGSMATVNVVFSDPGDLLSSASVAVEVSGRLIVGSVYDDHLLICELQQPSRRRLEEERHAGS